MSDLTFDGKVAIITGAPWSSPAAAPGSS